ncbi:hypothetical protein OIO90_001585 [Microbotryomycetes sp. JL221]|nr:hypothetical protein OIO90_001585 [Microbotryomycetes sp. JL221]
MAPSATSPTRPSAASALVSSSTPHVEEPTPTDLLLATPPAVLKFLTLSAPIIHGLTALSNLLLWQGSFFASLLVLLAWWAVCLFGDILLRFGLPAAVLLYIVVAYVASAATRTSATVKSSTRRHRHQSSPTLTPASYTHLLNSSHLLAQRVQALRVTLVLPLQQAVSFQSTAAGRPIPAHQTAWLCITIYPLYLILTFIVPLRLITLAIGSLFILWNAPFFRTLRVLLWRSAAMRWFCRLLIGVASGGKGVGKELARTRSGVGIPGLFGSKKKDKRNQIQEKPVKVVGGGTTKEDQDADEGEDVQVQFVVFENQRWWVGLDWTHALLPGERASWTDPALNPANPPTSFVLPPPSVTYTASPTRSDPNSRLKRTTEWKWLDPEWKVQRSSVATSAAAAVAGGGLVKSTSMGAISSSPGANTTPAAANAGRRSSMIASTSPTATTTSTSTDADAHPLPGHEGTLLQGMTRDAVGDENLFVHWLVDDEGWQYGDNHFEKMGPKGGLGKYTRRRAWVRRAGLVERCERVSGEVSSVVATTSTSTKVASAGVGQLGTAGAGLGTSSRAKSPTKDRDSSTRRRGGSSSSVKDKDGTELKRRKSSSSGKERSKKDVE